MGGVACVELTEREMHGLYVLLKTHEMELEQPMAGLLFKVEKILYERLTIEELENILKTHKKI